MPLLKCISDCRFREDKEKPRSLEGSGSASARSAEPEAPPGDSSPGEGTLLGGRPGGPLWSRGRALTWLDPAGLGGKLGRRLCARDGALRLWDPGHLQPDPGRARPAPRDGRGQRESGAGRGGAGRTGRAQVRPSPTRGREAEAGLPLPPPALLADPTTSTPLARHALSQGAPFPTPDPSLLFAPGTGTLSTPKTFRKDPESSVLLLPPFSPGKTASSSPPYSETHLRHLHR